MNAPDAALRLLAEALVQIANTPANATATVTVTTTAALGWSPERFWSAPPATQIDATELAASLGLSRGAIQRRVSQGMPCRRARDGTTHGVYVFTIGAVRDFLTESQEVVNAFTPRAARPRRVK